MIVDEGKNKVMSLKANPDQKPEPIAQPKLVDKEEISEFAKTLIIALLLAAVIRTFLYQPFNIPSGSMLPTLLVGDYLFVSKPAYGYSQYSFPFGLAKFEGRMMASSPQRGDVVVFRPPKTPNIDFIKRIIGLPGDTVQVIKGRLYINGVRAEREPVGLVESEDNAAYTPQRMMEYIETLPDGVMHRIYERSDMEDLDDTPLHTVPQGHYFMMGDNRDNSSDSRVMREVGFIPFDNIVGRADMLFFSVKEEANLFNPLTWPKNIRFQRLFQKIGPVRPAQPEFSVQ